MKYVKCRSVVAATGLSLALFGAACSTSTDSNETTSTTGAKSSATGSIVISGSSTVEPISTAVAEAFSSSNPDVDIAVDGPGTGDGFQLFCEGSTDMSNASRPIKDEEAAACESNGVEFIELKVGIDGLSVITSASNDSLRCVTFNDLYALVGPESTGFKNWSDAQELATELGSTSTFPDADLDVYGPGEESGTYDSFVEIVLEDLAEARNNDAQTRADYTSSPQDNVIVEGVAGSKTSLGWVGFAFATESEGVKALEVDDGESGCVAPTAESIAQGEYPIARDLFVYVNAKRVDGNPVVAQFVEFFLSDEGIRSVSDVGYVALDDSALAKTREAFKDRTTGSLANG